MYVRRACLTPRPYREETRVEFLKLTVDIGVELDEARAAVEADVPQRHELPHKRQPCAGL